MADIKINLAELEAVATDYMTAEQDVKSHPEYKNGAYWKRDRSAEYLHKCEYLERTGAAFNATCRVLGIDSGRLLKWARSLRKYAESTNWEKCIFPDRLSDKDYRKTIEYLKAPEMTEREAQADYVRYELRRYFGKRQSA